MMKTCVVLVAVLGLIYNAHALQFAYCKLRGTNMDPGIAGSVEFRDNGANIDVTIVASGITQNLGVNHGIHVHQYGDLTDTTTVGSHYNPTNQNHSCPPSTSRHYGDMGNWIIDAYGNINQTKTLDLLALTGANSIIGLSVVLHNTTDDCSSTGSSGNRLAYCVIGIGNPETIGLNTTNSAVSGATSVPMGICEFEPVLQGNSYVSGRAWLAPNQDGTLTVSAIINNLTDTHGFHLHLYGDLSDTSQGLSTAGHFDPYTYNHSIPTGDPTQLRHVGDLGNIFYVSGTQMLYRYTLEQYRINLTGINNVIGRGMVVHYNKDDCSQPTGNGGSRISYCVVGIAGPTVTVAPGIDFSNVPTTQDATACFAPSASPQPNEGNTLGAHTMLVLLMAMLMSWLI